MELSKYTVIIKTLSGAGRIILEADKILLLHPVFEDRKDSKI
jgi:hypothetical protein